MAASLARARDAVARTKLAASVWFALNASISCTFVPAHSGTGAVVLRQVGSASAPRVASLLAPLFGLVGLVVRCASLDRSKGSEHGEEGKTRALKKRSNIIIGETKRRCCDSERRGATAGRPPIATNQPLSAIARRLRNLVGFGGQCVVGAVVVVGVAVVVTKQRRRVRPFATARAGGVVFSVEGGLSGLVSVGLCIFSVEYTCTYATIW
jgi:hypothetical protein